MWEILGFENFVEQRVFIMLEPPYLLGQKGVIKLLHVSETHPALSL